MYINSLLDRWSLWVIRGCDFDDVLLTVKESLCQDMHNVDR